MIKSVAGAAIGQLWLFVVAPMLGGTAAAFVYKRIRALEGETEQWMEWAGIEPTVYQARLRARFTCPRP